MLQPLRLQAVRRMAAVAFAASLLLPAAAPAVAADPVVLRVGTVQDLDATNPYQTALVVGYEAFQLTYNLLVDFGPEPRARPRASRTPGSARPTGGRGRSRSGRA